MVLLKLVVCNRSSLGSEKLFCKCGFSGSMVADTDAGNCSLREGFVRFLSLQTTWPFLLSWVTAGHETQNEAGVFKIVESV